MTYLSWILSVMSALLALVPFWYIWRIIHDILEVSPDFSRAEKVTSYGWSAVLFAVISIVVYIAALMCSHISAFRVAANIRKELMRHITALPIGVTEKLWKRKAQANCKQFQCRYRKAILHTGCLTKREQLPRP